MRGALQRQRPPRRPPAAAAHPRSVRRPGRRPRPAARPPPWLRVRPAGLGGCCGPSAAPLPAVAAAVAAADWPGWGAAHAGSGRVAVGQGDGLEGGRVQGARRERGGDRLLQWGGRLRGRDPRACCRRSAQRPREGRPSTGAQERSGLLGRRRPRSCNAIGAITAAGQPAPCPVLACSLRDAPRIARHSVPRPPIGPSAPSFAPRTMSLAAQTGRLSVLCTRAFTRPHQARGGVARQLGEAFVGSTAPLRCAPWALRGRLVCMAAAMPELSGLWGPSPTPPAPWASPGHWCMPASTPAGSSRRPAAAAPARRLAACSSASWRRRAPRARPSSPCPTRPAWMPWPR